MAKVLVFKESTWVYNTSISIWSETTAMRPRTKKIILTIASVLGIVLGGFALLVGYVRWDFHRRHPYGWSHCCDLQLGEDKGDILLFLL